MKFFRLLLLLILPALPCRAESSTPPGFTDAAEFGFSPMSSGLENTRALQQAVDRGGTIVVHVTGTYAVAGTVYLGSQTDLRFGAGVFLKKSLEAGPFSHVLVNKGAATRTWNEQIAVRGLQLIVNGVDARTFSEAFGLHGQLAFFYTKQLRIEGFRCLDLGPNQYGIQICTFEDATVADVVVKGMKDGVHFGRGKRFTVRDGVFETYDDAIALNGHDYSTGNPELGWIEDGVIENCIDLNAAKTTGYFARILAGGWVDWKAGMEVQQSDTVVSQGRLYRVQMKPDGQTYRSLTQPTHLTGKAELDGITWGVVQSDVTYTAGVRNVVFRDILLEKPRTAFSIHFDCDKYSRSYYPGAPIPVQQGIVLDRIQVLHPDTASKPLLKIGTPVDAVQVVNSSLGDNPMLFVTNRAMTDYGPTVINLCGCTFRKVGPMQLLKNSVPGKVIRLQTSASVVLDPTFQAAVEAGDGKVTVASDLPDLRDKTP